MRGATRRVFKQEFHVLYIKLPRVMLYNSFYLRALSFPRQPYSVDNTQSQAYKLQRCIPD